MERRTRDARPALRSLFGPASFGPAGVIEPIRQNRSRSGHADQRLWLRRGSCRSRWAPRDRRNNHQDDDRRPTLSRFLPRHVPFPLAAYLHVSGVGPSESTLRGTKARCVPLQGEGTARFTRSRDEPRARHAVQRRVAAVRTQERRARGISEGTAPSMAKPR